jgi:hypothetical protein
VLLEEASLRQDRARGAIGTSDGKATLGLAVSADTARGGSLGTVGAVGPSVHAGYGSALGNVGTAGSDIEVATLHEPGVGSTTLVLHHGEVRADARAGAVLFDVQGRTRAVVTLGERDTGHTALAGVSGRISAPFVKRFGSSAAPLQHWITPSVVATIGAADTAVPSVAPALVPDGWFGIVMPGLSTAFGEVANGRSALTVSVQSGGMAERESDAKGFVAESSVADARLFAFHEEAVLMLGSPRSALHVFEARVGEVNGLFISAHLHESFGEPPLIARFAFSGLDAGWDAPWVPWFSAPGSTVGARVGVPWAPWLSNAVDVDYDVTNERLLGVRGSLRYLHPCGCLRVSLWGAQRLGRSGVDSFLTVDLAEP